jgi:hypothetical protein
MTDEPLAAAIEAFASDERFQEADDQEFDATRTPFEGRVNLEVEDDEVVYRVVSRVPMLDSVVEGETVAEIVEEGWYETLERRLVDIPQATDVETTAPEIRQEVGTVVVESTFRDTDPSRAPGEAQAIVDYVVGTWMEGVIPGYEYTDDVQALRERASRNYDERNQGADLSL